MFSELDYNPLIMKYNHFLLQMYDLLGWENIEVFFRRCVKKFSPPFGPEASWFQDHRFAHFMENVFPFNI